MLNTYIYHLEIYVFNIICAYSWLQCMIDKLIDIGRCYGIEMNVEKTKVMRISKQQSAVTIMIDQKHLENVECFKYLGSMLTNDGRCTVKLNVRL